MKQSLLPLALLALIPVAVNADVTVYGKANVSLQNSDEEVSGTKVELVSNASRIGLKGSEDIREGLKVIYQFEYQTEVDDGSNSSGTFSQRNIYVGLESSAGTVMAGLFDTPLKVVQEKVDLFNDLEGDIKNIFNGEVRAKNIVQYITPKAWGPVSSSVAYITHEEEGVDDGVSASVSYSNTTFYLGLAVDSDVQQGTDTARLAARYTLGQVHLGALYETNDDGVSDEDGLLVSALWKLSSQWGLKAQYGESDINAPDNKMLSVGADYYLSKNATVYGFYTQVENGLAITSSKVRDDNYLGIGMEYKF